MNQHSITKCVCGNTLRRCRCPGPHSLIVAPGPCTCKNPATPRPGPGRDATVESVTGAFNENDKLRTLCGEMIASLLIPQNQPFLQPEVVRMAEGWKRRLDALTRKGGSNE